MEGWASIGYGGEPSWRPSSNAFQILFPCSEILRRRHLEQMVFLNLRSQLKVLHQSSEVIQITNLRQNIFFVFFWNSQVLYQCIVILLTTGLNIFFVFSGIRLTTDFEQIIRGITRPLPPQKDPPDHTPKKNKKQTPPSLQKKKPQHFLRPLEGTQNPALTY